MGLRIVWESEGGKVREGEDDNEEGRVRTDVRIMAFSSALPCRITAMKRRRRDGEEGRREMS